MRIRPAKHAYKGARRRTKRRFVGHARNCPYPNLTARNDGFDTVDLSWCNCGMVSIELTWAMVTINLLLEDI